MRLLFRPAALAAMTVLGAMTLLVGPAAASPALERLASRLSGTWNEVMRAQPGCDNRQYAHRFSLSPDGRVLTKRYLTPVEGNFGRVSEERYRVLYGDERSVVLFREGETFEHRDTGDKVVRQLILESDTAYAWRVYGMPRDHRAAAGGQRCGD